MGSVLRREVEVVAPLASEPSGVGQSRAGSSRGVLLGCYFLLLLLMVITRFQSAASDSRAGAPFVVESVLIVAQVASRGAGGLGGGLLLVGGNI